MKISGKIGEVFILLIIMTGILLLTKCGNKEVNQTWKSLLDSSHEWVGKNVDPGYHPFSLKKIEESEKILKFQAKSNEAWTNYKGIQTSTNAIYYYKLDKTTGKGEWVGKVINILGTEGEVISSGELHLTGYKEGELNFLYITEYNNPKRPVDSATMQGRFDVRSY